MSLYGRGSGLDMIPPGVDLCAIPAGPPPPGVVPNLVNPVSLEPTIIAISTIMLTLSTVVFAGRLFVTVKSLKAADWMMFVGFLFNVGMTATQIATAKYYRHIWDTPICFLLGRYMKLLLAIEVVTGPALFFPKASIFLFYMQIFSSSKIIRKLSIAGIVIAFLAYFPASLFLTYYNAPHIGQTWAELAMSDMPHKGIPGGITIGVASVIVDIYIFVLPLPTLSKLNMTLARRLQVISLFATAFLGVVASVICLVYRVKLLGLHDVTWQAGIVGIPIIVENNVAIIVGSLPAFAGFLRKYVADSSVYKSIRSKLFTSTGGSKDDWQQKDATRTIGSREKPSKKMSYYELSECNTLKSITVPQESHIAGRSPEDGILRTVSFNQHANNRSVDRLV